VTDENFKEQGMHMKKEQLESKSEKSCKQFPVNLKKKIYSNYYHLPWDNFCTWKINHTFVKQIFAILVQNLGSD